MSIANKLETIAENVPKVYQAGMDAKEIEWWDALTNNYQRNDYRCAFAFSGAEYLRPPQKITPVLNADRVFNTCKNLKKVESSCFDFSHLNYATANNFSWYYTFYDCINIEEIEDIGIKANFNHSYTFANCNKLHTIAKIEYDKNTRINNMYDYCYELKNLTVEGTIGQNGLSVRHSTKLSHDSLVSIINALSTTTSGLTVTLSNIAVNKAFETASGANDGSESAEWLALIGTRSNWTISLA